MRLKKVYSKVLLVAGLLFAGPRNAQAQSESEAPRCATEEMNIAVYGSREAMMNALLRDYQESLLNNGAQNPTGAYKTTESGFRPRSKFVIPCVVHVVHTGLPSDSIPLEQVRAQFEYSFDDYRRVPGTAGWGPGVDTEIEFSLATRDPNGNPHPGVIYLNNPTLSNGGQALDAQLKAASRWNARRYYNIYVVRNINSTPTGTTLGYAFYPNAINSRDGTVCLADRFGSRAGSSYARTTTHEFGHALNLAHPFEGGCGNSSCTSSGDFICDTPPTAKENFGSNSSRRNTCTNDSPDLPDNPRNYMDYADENLNSFFTPLQKVRMHNVMNSPVYTQRYDLWQASNLQFTGTGPWGPPVAKFAAQVRQGVVGKPIQLYDYSRNTPTIYKWNIPGARFVTSDTTAHPQVVFDSPGTYDVELIVGNLNVDGITDTTKIEGYLTVLDTLASVPFEEGFDGQSFPPRGWYVDNPDSIRPIGVLGWERRLGTFTPAGGFGQSSNSAYIRNFFHAEYNAQDALVSVPFTLQGQNKGSLIFSYAYRPTIVVPLFYADTLSVEVTTDGGSNWTNLWQRGGTELATFGNNSNFAQLTEFVPTATQWKRDTICLREYLAEDNLRIRFRVTNRWGNNLYIDDFRVDTLEPETCKVTANDPRLETSASMVLMPNPTTSTTTLHLNLRTAEEVLYSLVDLQGRTVRSESLGLLPTGLHSHSMDLSQLPAGLYLVQVSAGAQRLTERVVKY